jgi:hypothetical protein
LQYLNLKFLDLTIGFDDICNRAEVVITSTNHRFAYFCDYIIVSKVLKGVVFANILNHHWRKIGINDQLIQLPTLRNSATYFAL